MKTRVKVVSRVSMMTVQVSRRSGLGVTLAGVGTILCWVSKTYPTQAVLLVALSVPHDKFLQFLHLCSKVSAHTQCLVFQYSN